MKSGYRLLKFTLGLAIILFSVYTNLPAQENPKREVDIESFVQQLFPHQNQDLPYEELYETLFQFYQSPIDLNSATREELGSLYLLSESQINNFFQYREKQKEFISVYELQAVPGYDVTIIYKLIPFVKVGERGRYKNLWTDLVERDKYFLLKYETTLEKKEGYKKGEQSFQGNADKIYGRFRASNPKQYSLGFTFEKDAGEKLKWSPPKDKYGFDFYSYHIQVKNKGRLKSLLIGDYQLQFGQGLVLGAGFLPGKGAESVAPLRRYNNGVRPYTSVVESGYFRGAAGTYAINSFDITGYYSKVNQDAVIHIDSLGEDSVRSFQITGLHRTASEAASRKQINARNYGGNITYNVNRDLNIGITFSATQFEYPLIKKPNKYNQYEFSGDDNYVYALNYGYIIQNFNLFGEVAQSKSGGWGVVSGVIASLSAKVDFSLLYRNYERNFHSFFGNAFGENSRNANEEGIYLGLKFLPIRRLIITAYADRYYKPWLSYQAYAPTHGSDYMVRVGYLPKKTINVYAQLRYDVKEKNQKGDDNILATITPQSTINFLLNLDFKPLESLHLKSRFQASKVSQGEYDSKGMALSQDVVLEVGRFKISGRYSLFDTDDYASRQYGYEKDVLYTFSIPALHGEGIRNYLMVEFNVNRSIDVWVRASRTRYNNVESIGSGLDEINGDSKTDLKFQVRYKF